MSLRRAMGLPPLSDEIRERWREIFTFPAGDSPVRFNKHVDEGPPIAAFLVFRTGAAVPVFADEDVMAFRFDWRDPEPCWGEGRYVFRDGDWVRP
jgi:hypothetical protein